MLQIDWLKFWVKFCVKLQAFFNICLNIYRRAISDPKNKRFESFVSTKQNCLVISVIVFTDSNTKNGPKFQNLENHNKSHFLIMGTSFQNALKSWIFEVGPCFFFANNVFLPIFFRYALGFFTAFPSFAVEGGPYAGSPCT